MFPSARAPFIAVSGKTGLGAVPHVQKKVAILHDAAGPERSGIFLAVFSPHNFNPG
jgi:hypothetical protein